MVKHIPAGQLRSVVLLTDFKTLPEGQADHLRLRDDVLQARARVTLLSPSKRLDWAANNDGTSPTHQIDMRMPEAHYIGANNWLYHYKRHGGVWCRIVGAQDLDDWQTYVRLIVSADEIADRRQDKAEVPPLVVDKGDPRQKQIIVEGPRYD